MDLVLAAVVLEVPEGWVLWGQLQAAEWEKDKSGRGEGGGGGEDTAA